MKDCNHNAINNKMTAIKEDFHIFVGGIPNQLSVESVQEQLQKTFEVYEQIKNIRCIPQNEKTNKGYAFITFCNEPSAELLKKIINDNDKMIHLLGKCLSVRDSSGKESRDDRRSQQTWDYDRKTIEEMVARVLRRVADKAFGEWVSFYKFEKILEKEVLITRGGSKRKITTYMGSHGGVNSFLSHVARKASINYFVDENGAIWIKS